MTAGGVIIRGKGGAGNRFIICGLTHPRLRQEPSAVLFLFPYLVHVSARVHLSSFVGSELASKEKEVQTRSGGTTSSPQTQAQHDHWSRTTSFWASRRAPSRGPRAPSQGPRTPGQEGPRAPSQGSQPGFESGPRVRAHWPRVRAHRPRVTGPSGTVPETEPTAHRLL